jgi:hypothetical protein
LGTLLRLPCQLLLSYSKEWMLFIILKERNSDINELFYTNGIKLHAGLNKWLGMYHYRKLRQEDGMDYSHLCVSNDVGDEYHYIMCCKI